MNKLVITDDDLPNLFENQIDVNKSNAEVTIIRSSLKQYEDIDQWVRKFAYKTRTHWNLRNSKPKGTQIVCSKKFVCHHSRFMKVASNENKKGISKNSDCQSQLSVQIKLNTVNTRAKDSFVKQGLCGVITVKNVHSHTISSAQTLRFLPADLGVRDKFWGYFDDGMGITESRKHHNHVLEFMGGHEVEYDLASGKSNPTYRTVRYWHDQWRLVNLGPRSGSGVLEKLKEKQAIYANENITVLFKEEPFTVLIMTPLMKRAHELQTAKDIVFMDSISSCDSENHSITFLLTPCAVGAVPLGIILSKGQTCDAYCTGLDLLKSAIDSPFCGQGYPQIFLTDHSTAEINAIQKTFPQSKTYLRIFHVLQAVWRWLWDTKHEIPKDHRPILMRNFKKNLYSFTILEAEDAYRHAMEDNTNESEKWRRHLEKYWEIKDQWCLAWRDMRCRGHFTNNFSEVCVRLFKDNVLSRVKAYNVVSLVDFVCSGLESYYRHRLREFADSRDSNARLFLQNLMKKTEYLEKEDITRINAFEFQVPNSSEEEPVDTYYVDCETGCCSCKVGQTGKFCKHQCAVYRYFDVKPQNFPPTSAADRHQIAALVLGDKTPPMAFYESFNLPKINEDDAASNVNNSQNYSETQEGLCAREKHVDAHHKKQTNISSTEEEADIAPIISLIQQCGARFGSSVSGVNKMTERLKKIRSKGQWESFLHTAGSCVNLRRRDGSAIKVQPTSLSRRKPGVTRGSKRLPLGRPAIGEGVIKKRRRNLARNIENNQPNAKSHGKNH